MRIAIVGSGKMGRAVAAAAVAGGHEVTAEIGRDGLTKAALADACVAFEFTEPRAAPHNLIRLAEFRVPAVCGTTGWYQHLPEVRHAVEHHESALVYAPNFSLGAQILLNLAQAAGRVLSRLPEFDAYIIERHHRDKKDVPSGTAKVLRDALAAADPGRALSVTSIRAGAIPGTHEIHIDGPGETVTIAHTARDRSIFARGAVVAAEWITARHRCGVFTFEQVLSGADA